MTEVKVVEKSLDIFFFAALKTFNLLTLAAGVPSVSEVPKKAT